MKNKKGISLITLAVTIVVMIILASIVIMTLTNAGLIKDSKEAKYKNELKAFDEEIREKITTVYLDDKTAMYRIITDVEEISKYSEDLVKSEYIDYAYISGGELTLRGNMLTEEQKKWAQEANIKIDDEEVTFTEEKVMISLSEEEWTYGPISATLSFSEIPKGYEFQYKIGDGKWTSKESIADITRNGTIYARLYNKENYNEIGVNSKDITKIDRISPKIEKVIEPSMWEKDSVKLVVSGAKDNESGLAEKPYSFDDGITWQAANYKDFTTNMSGIIIKIKDAVGNIYTHDSVDITRIDKISPTIESVTGNASEFVTGSVILKVNGAKDNESGLNEIAYSFDNGASWQKSNEKEFKNNTSNIIIQVRDAVGNIYTHTAMNIVKIDNEGPEIPTGITVTPHLNKLVAQGKGSVDSGSGLAGYKYSLDNSTWTDMIPEAQAYEFTGIKSSTSKTIYVKAVDKLGNESKVYGPLNASTLAITDKVQINLSTDKPTQGPISADLTYNNVPSGYEVQYKLEEQTDYSSGIKITGINENTVITARLYNKTLQDEVALNTKPVTNIDREAPTMSNVSGNPADWVNTDITLTINGAKDNSGILSDKPYSFDNGATWQAENTKTYTTNTSNIVIKVKDYAGNIYTYPTVNITKIDKQEPTITNVSGNPTDYVNTDVTLTINGADDNASGLHKIETYSFDGGNTWQSINTKTYSENTSNIIIKVKDAAGNIYTHTKIDITKIDKQAPSKPTGISVTSGLNTLTVKASGSTDDGSGLAGYKYSLDDITWSDLITSENTYTFDSIKSDTTVTIYAKAVDKLGWESSVYGPVGGKTTAVTNKVAITLSEEDWTQGPITADLSYTDIPTGYVIQYKIGTGNWTTGTKTPDISANTTVYGRLYNESLDDEIAANSKSVTKIDGKEPTITSITGNPTTWTKDDVTLTINGAEDTTSGLHATETYSFDNGATWQTSNTKTYSSNISNIIIKVKDKVGNIYTHTAINITYIDKTAPTITSVTGNPTAWTKDDVTLTINGASDSASGLHKTETYSFDNGVTWQTSNTKTYTTNTSGIVIKVKDAVGNIYTHELIDIEYINNTEPTITNITGNPTDWVNSDVTLTINGAEDIGCGLHETETYSFDNGETWQIQNTKTYTQNTSNIIIKVKNKAGNVYTHTPINITYIDKNAPNITDVTGNPTDYVNTDVTLTVNGAKDNESGLHSTQTYSFDNGATWQTSNTKTYSENTSNIIIKVKDAVGNIYTHTKIDITKIDKEAPSKPTAISVTPSLNSLTVKANGSTDAGSGIAGYKYSLDGNNWTVLIEDGSTYTFSSIKSGTTVKVYAKAVDKLGWESSAYGPVDGTTSTVTNKVTITLSEEDWTKGPITADLSYTDIPTGYVLQYKIGDGSWTPGKQITDIEENITLYARLYNEDLEDEIATNTKAVSKIDNEPPTDPTGLEVVTRNQTSIVVKASGSTDAGSGLAGYQYSINGTSWSETVASGTNHTISSLTVNSKYTVYVRAVDALGNISNNNYTKEVTTLSTYSVTYNSNTTDAVSSMPTAQTKVEGVTLQLSTSTPTRTGYIFKGWSTTSSGSVEYAAGANYTADSELVLYAVWEMAYYQNTTTSKLYVTLNEALTDSATSTQINAIRNATENVIATNTSGKTITLNLNGKTIAFNDGYNLVNAGTLTLIGSGKITANTGYTINNSGTLNVNLDNETSYNDGTGGIIETTSHLNPDRAVQNTGTVNLNSGVIVNSATAANVTTDSTPFALVSGAAATLNINGGIIRAISSDEYPQCALYSSGTLNISGGLVEAVATAVSVAGNGNVAITGGQIKAGGINNTSGGIGILHNSTGTLNISGTNKVEIYSRIATGILSQSTGSVIINNVNCSVTALIRAIYNFSTGQVTVSNGTVKITSTTSSGNCIHNSAGGKIIINGGTVQASTNSTIYNAAAGTIEINGGTISSLSGMTNNAGGTVKITGGTITGTNSQGILNNGAGTINITGGSVIGYNHGIYGNTNSTGTVSITGGSITGQNSTGIIGKFGTVTLGTNDSTISTTSPAITGKTYGINMTSGTLNFYDGVVKGTTAINNTVTGLPTNYGVATTTANSVQTATLAKKYYVKYNANGGSGTMANSTHLYGVSKALTANAFTRTGYNFLGWSTSSTATTATYTNSQSVSNLTTTAGATVNLYAVWQAKTVEVTFMRNTSTSDTTSAKQTFTYGVTGQSFSAKGWTKSGYTLLGWSASSTATAKTWNVTSGVTDAWINSNSPKITIYAVWEYNTSDKVFFSSGNTGSIDSSGQYTISASGGNAGGSSQTAYILIPKGATVYYTSTATSGNGGSGWATIGDSYGVGTSSSNTVTETESFTVTSESYLKIYVGGSGGYSAGGSGTVTITKVVNSSGVQCTFEIRDVYKVSYNANKGSSAPATQYKPKDINITLTTSKPTRTNFTFKGWATSATATTATYQPGATYSTNSNLSLYAIWESVDPSRTLTFTNGNGISGGGGNQSGGGNGSNISVPANVTVYYTLTASQTGGGTGTAYISFAGTQKDTVSSSSTSGQTVTKSGSFTTTASGTVSLSVSGSGGTGAYGSGTATITKIVGTNGTEYILDW